MFLHLGLKCMLELLMARRCVQDGKWCITAIQPSSALFEKKDSQPEDFPQKCGEALNSLFLWITTEDYLIPSSLDEVITHACHNRRRNCIIFFSLPLSLNPKASVQMFPPSIRMWFCCLLRSCFFLYVFFFFFFAKGRHKEKERCWDTWRRRRVCSCLAAGSQTVSARAAPRNTTCCHLGNKSRRWDSAHSSARRDAVAHLLKLSLFFFLTPAVDTWDQSCSGDIRERQHTHLWVHFPPLLSPLPPLLLSLRFMQLSLFLTSPRSRIGKISMWIFAHAPSKVDLRFLA